MPRLCSLVRSHVPSFVSLPPPPLLGCVFLSLRFCSFLLFLHRQRNSAFCSSVSFFPLRILCPQYTDSRGSSAAFLLHIVSFSPYLFFFIVFFSPPPCSYTSVRSLWLCLSCGFCFCFMYFFFRFFHLSSTFCCCCGALEKASLFCNQLEYKHFCMHFVLLLLYFGSVPLLLQVEDVCC